MSTPRPLHAARSRRACLSLSALLTLAALTLTATPARAGDTDLDDRGVGLDLIMPMGQGYLFDDYIDPDISDTIAIGFLARLHTWPELAFEAGVEAHFRGAGNDTYHLYETRWHARLGAAYYFAACDWCESYLAAGLLLGDNAIELTTAATAGYQSLDTTHTFEAGGYLALGFSALPFAWDHVGFLLGSELQLAVLGRDLASAPARDYTRQSDDVIVMLSWSVQLGMSMRGW